ncbi:MAG: RNA recognition motif domain-containing protein [Patescibacteria group bacterium]|jgi:RNA recognition motif-containing protein
MAKNLFVGKLPYSITDAELEEVFAKVGKVVSAKVIMDKVTGQGKGFGFVEMETEEDAQRAVSELNNSTLDGRNIVVNEARPREPRENNRY